MKLHKSKAVNFQKDKIMKTLVVKSTIFLSFLFALMSCVNDDTLEHLKVTTVKTLYAPDNNKAVKLESSASANILFEWEQAKAEDGGLVMYEVAFDVEGGDFSKPIYKLTSDNNGTYNYATVTHKTLNKIGALAGLNSSETGNIIWTVFSSKGVNEVKAEEVRTMTITRLAGFAEVPTDVYVTGEGSEGGADLSKAIKFKAVANGEFEIYTKLTAGKKYHFADGTNAAAKTYFADGEVLKENGESTVAKTGVYRINLDFTTGAVIYTEISKMEIFFAPTNSYLFELPYVGQGVWNAASQPITFKQEGWGRDERYKFRMTVKEGTEFEWFGSVNGDNSRPNNSTPESFWYMVPVSGDQWNNCFKFAGEIDNSLSDVSVVFQADNSYTHIIKKVGDQ